MTFRGKGLKRRADGRLVHEDYLICDGYQRGRGCRAGTHFAYAVAESAVLDAVLAEALDDRHFAQRDEVLELEREAAGRERRRDAAIARRDTALSLYLDTQRPEVRESWSAAVALVEGLDAELARLAERIVAARGAVAPEEHRRRIAEKRASLAAEEGNVRFSARALVMEALRDLIVSMTFHVDPKGIDMELIDGRRVHAFWDEDEATWDLAVDAGRRENRPERARQGRSGPRSSAAAPKDGAPGAGGGPTRPGPTLRLVSG